MSKKTAIILIILVTLLALGSVLAFYFYFYGKTGYTARGFLGEGSETTNPVFPGTGASAPKNAGTSGGTPTIEENGPETTLGETGATLIQIFPNPIAGATLVDKKGSPTLARFIERTTGHIFERPLFATTTLTRRLSNKTIPKLQETLWSKDGQRVIVRYEREGEERVETFSGSIKPRASNPNEGELVGIFLPANIRSIAVNPNAEKIFYLTRDSSGSRGMTAKIDGAGKAEIFSSPLREWNVDWPNESVVTLTTKPSAGIAGSLFSVPSVGGTATKILSGILGLTAKMNIDRSFILYSESGNENEITLRSLNLRDGTVREISLSTLPEKCVWSKRERASAFCAVPEELPTGGYPDSWYSGFVSFADDLWKINVETGSANFITTLQDTSENPFDAISLSLSEDEKILLFTDKNTLTPWALRMK